MQSAKSAVPTWIMPLSRVAENYDARTTRFDVVIMDEASQMDVTGLLAFYLGKQVIVVGDDEQVSPEAVGQRLDEVQQLINEFLYDIPNKNLYDGKASVYDLARTAFGGTIGLREHFRCVPEIIGYSNQLSYNNTLIPLRESSESELLPHVVARRVSGLAEDKVNSEEIAEVSRLIASCINKPEYNGKTFGVISLVGDEQALAIESLLRRTLDPKVIEERKILCGNPRHFQGDERDVIFLSMVDSADGNKLRKRDEPMFKKRFNVACSRARDQMWLVHSIGTDALQVGDLRRGLIEYVQNPIQERSVPERSSFDKEGLEYDLARRLRAKGFDVTVHHPVGQYDLDIVVEGHSRRMAIDCDGEVEATRVQLQEDLERQAVLERVGWTFHRVTAFNFYLNPENIVRRLEERLQSIGIRPRVADAAAG